MPCDRKFITGIPSFSGQGVDKTPNFEHSALAVYGHLPSSLFKMPRSIPGVATLRKAVSANTMARSVSAPQLGRAKTARKAGDAGAGGAGSGGSGKKKKYVETYIITKQEQGLEVSSEEASLAAQLTSWRAKEAGGKVGREQGGGRAGLARTEIIELELDLHKCVTLKP
jgi:hypothetical protein